MAVLHIVFMILKIIGILLLILLGILLLGVLALLFCPVRYQARGYRDKEQYGGKAGSFFLAVALFSVFCLSGPTSGLPSSVSASEGSKAFFSSVRIASLEGGVWGSRIFFPLFSPVFFLFLCFRALKSFRTGIPKILIS